MKKIVSLVLCFLLTLSYITMIPTSTFASSKINYRTELSKNNFTVKNIKRLEMKIPKGSTNDINEIIKLYKSDGWEINSRLGYFYKDVLYDGEQIEIDGAVYETNESGEFSTRLSTRKTNRRVVVSSEGYNTTPISIISQPLTRKKQRVKLNNEMTTVILCEEINIDEMIAKMSSRANNIKKAVTHFLISR